MPNFAA